MTDFTNDKGYLEIRKEANRFLEANKGRECLGGYLSPRVSSEIYDCSMPLTFDHYNFCSLGCLYCAVAGTLIATPGRATPIEVLKSGDPVYSYNLKTGDIELDEVVSFMTKKSNKIFKITLEDGKMLELTAEHPIFTRRGWVNAEDLQETDEILTSSKPGAAFSMQNNNPMKKPAVVKKQSAALKESFASGKLDDLKRKLSIAGKRNIIACNKSEKQIATVKQRMTSNNPMWNPIHRNKMSKTVKQSFANGTRIPPALGNPRPDMKKRMLSKNNPMKDKDTARRVLTKGRKTLLKKGGISEGQNRVRKLLIELNLNFIEEMPIAGPSRSFFMDFFLPDIKICLEYDGHSKHYYKEGKAMDTKRDEYLLRQHKIRTLRLHRNLPFRKTAMQELQTLLGEVK